MRIILPFLTKTPCRTNNDHIITTYTKPQILSAVFVVLLFFAVGFFKLLYEIQERGAVNFVCFEATIAGAPKFKNRALRIVDAKALAVFIVYTHAVRGSGSSVPFAQIFRIVVNIREYVDLVFGQLIGKGRVGPYLYFFHL